MTSAPLTLTDPPVGVSKSHKKQIQWRRRMVLELICQGTVNTIAIADKLRVSQATINRDKRWLAMDAYSKTQSFYENILDFSQVRNGTYELIEHAWQIVKSEADDNTRIQAMYVIAANYQTICKLSFGSGILHKAKELNDQQNKKTV